MKHGSDSRYYCSKDIRVAQGVSGTVKFRGKLEKYLLPMLQGVRHGMQAIGSKTVPEINGYSTFEVRSSAAKTEGNVHDLLSFEL